MFRFAPEHVNVAAGQVIGCCNAGKQGAKIGWGRDAAAGFVFV